MSQSGSYTFDKPLSSPRGSVFLIHGSAPFNVDGRIPHDGVDSPYAREPFYRDLALNLVAAGWNVLRYAKPGVAPGRIDQAVYSTTDLNVISKQLVHLWHLLPTSIPRVVFAWSEGSLHVRALPVGEIDALILLGAVATNIGDVIESQGGPSRHDLARELSTADRAEMLGLDRPVGRLVDELALAPNWTVFAGHPDLPILILHGSVDREVPCDQARVWRDKLRDHNITVTISQGFDHRFMPTGKYDNELLTETIIAWLNASVPDV